MIHAVLFDLDGTLLDRERTLDAFIHAQHRRLRAALAPVSEEEFCSRFLDLDNYGQVWKDRVYEELVREFGITSMTAEALFDDYLRAIPKHVVPYPGLPEVLKTLRARNLALGLVTNGPYKHQLHNFEALGVRESFSTVLISEREGVQKPDPEIFRRALERLGVAPAEAVFVGDHPEQDIRGANAAGLCTVFRPTAPHRSCAEADAVCKELAQLPSILGGLEATS